jgi:hypothetical protein
MILKACELILEIFDYFSFEPYMNEKCPVIIFLVGNKADCKD